MSDSFSIGELRSALETASTPRSSNKSIRPRGRAAQKKRAAAKNAAQKEKAAAAAQTELLTPSEKPWKPKFDTFLVLDVEATCERDSPGRLAAPKNLRFEFPNEIIEFPVLVMQWIPPDGRATAPDSWETLHCLRQLAVFRRIVRPTWRPHLSKFCRTLTGISQDEVDRSQTWAEVLHDFCEFLTSHDLLVQADEPDAGSLGGEAYEHLSLKSNVTWVTHGPCDLDDFVQKQFYISRHVPGRPTPGGTPVARVPEYPPPFLRRPMLDIRLATASWAESADVKRHAEADLLCSGLDEEAAEKLRAALCPPLLAAPSQNGRSGGGGPARRRLADGTLAGCLSAFGMKFQGQQHRGHDDAYNVARVLDALLESIESAWVVVRMMQQAYAAKRTKAAEKTTGSGSSSSDWRQQDGQAFRSSKASASSDHRHSEDLPPSPIKDNQEADEEPLDVVEAYEGVRAAITATTRLEQQCLVPFRHDRAGPRKRWFWMQRGIVDYDQEADVG